MRDISERIAVELRWSEVCDIVSAEINEILGLHVQCKTNVIENSFWDVTFIGCRLPLPKLCQLLQATQATPEDWEDALPDEGGVDVGGLGIVLSEKLISRHLALTWEHHLITVDSLWLVGVTKGRSHEPKQG
ncbi:MAG: hypothetical protein HDT18_08345 [Oscillibacter sp.]|nr:hypothetical protein [Oscillibacter sp.]